jgi:hypothetical protein
MRCAGGTSALERNTDSSQTSRHVRKVPTTSKEKPHEGGSQFKPDVLDHAAINAGLDFRR